MKRLIKSIKLIPKDLLFVGILCLSNFFIPIKIFPLLGIIGIVIISIIIIGILIDTFL